MCRNNEFCITDYILFLLISNLILTASGSTQLAEDCNIHQLKQHCQNINQNDYFDIISCVNMVKENNLDTVSSACQKHLWNFTIDLLKNEKLHQVSHDYCDSSVLLGCTNLKNFNFLMCLIDNVNNLKKIDQKCIHFIQMIKTLIFSDLQDFSYLLKECQNDIVKICQKYVKSSPGSKTLSCLQDNVNILENNCREQVLHLSEIQSEDIKFDKGLYINCAIERQKFCREAQLGQVYNCLMLHKLEDISQQCEKELFRHEQLIVKDYRISKGLARACKDDIKTYHCRKMISPTFDRDTRLSQILLCLENITKSGLIIQQECSVEMITHRKILMEDYRLSPELVTSCSMDIKKFCNKLEAGGKTIHCLMQYSRYKNSDKVSSECQRELENLIKETDAGEDWRIDPILREACQDVVSVACRHITGGDAKVISCLMERLGTEMMTEECETALIQIQYFVSRDIRLDPGLWRSCRDDAVKYCHVSKAWSTNKVLIGPSLGPMVIPCLYQLATTTNSKFKVQSQCYDEIKRVMRQRALSVELNPSVELACIEDLGTFCMNNTGVGAEITCLQDNLENLIPKCKDAVTSFTEVQAAHLEMNPIITSNCKMVIENFCQNEFKHGNGGDVFDCLVEHKNEPFMKYNPKCKAAVEHQQLISLKDYHFTFKFKEACYSYVSRYCGENKSGKPNYNVKQYVVSCLSEVIRNDTLRDHKQRIPRECRQQIKGQLLQMRESIKLNPSVNEVCHDDIIKYCNNGQSRLQTGNGRILECLMEVRKNLSEKCYKEIFKIMRFNLLDNSVDYTLNAKCNSMTAKYCQNIPSSDIFECLKKFKYEPDFDYDCRVVVIRRLIEQFSDYRFNKNLETGCMKDISNHCAKVIAEQPPDKELQGKVTNCLKIKFRLGILSNKCKEQLVIFLKESALNYKLNYLLTTMCASEIKNLCNNKKEELFGDGNVEECLKRALMKGEINNIACRTEVVELIQEGKADINVDPILHQKCTTDISRFCSHIPKGASRQLNCLIEILNGKNEDRNLEIECSSMLKLRLELFKIQPEQSVKDFGQLYNQVTQSPSKKYFIVLCFTFVGMIFIIGMFCGRVSRKYTLLKNK